MQTIKLQRDLNCNYLIFHFVRKINHVRCSTNQIKARLMNTLRYLYDTYWFLCNPSHINAKSDANILFPFQLAIFSGVHASSLNGVERSAVSGAAMAEVAWPTAPDARWRRGGGASRGAPRHSARRCQVSRCRSRLGDWEHGQQHSGRRCSVSPAGGRRCCSVETKRGEKNTDEFRSNRSHR